MKLDDDGEVAVANVTVLVREGDDTAQIDLFYPRNSQVKWLDVGLIDVRAADGIRIGYDFKRDGWTIQQASTFEWEGDDPICDPDWQEVAFVQAWARKKHTEA